MVSWTGKINIPLFPCVPENLVSRDGFSRPVPRQPAHLHTQAESGAYPNSSWVPRRRPFMKPPYAIGSVPSLSGHAIAYRWRSLPRVRRHRASKPQGSSERVLPWQVTMDQLIRYAPLFPIGQGSGIISRLVKLFIVSYTKQRLIPLPGTEQSLLIGPLIGACSHTYYMRAHRLFRTSWPGFITLPFLNKNLDAPRPSEHPPVRRGNVKTFI